MGAASIAVETSTTSAQPPALLPQQVEAQKETIVALNNAAVDLLHGGGACKCAIDTFKDGLELLKTSTDPVCAARAVERAQQRLTNRPAVPPEGPNANLVVLEYTHDPGQAYNLLSNVRTSKVCLILDNASDVSLALVRAVLVYNYGIAHRCCVAPDQTAAQLGGFCVQIFQYAESILPESANLLFRMVLTRNLMMLSCRLGMQLCEHYKETLDPIEADILGPPQPDGENHTTPAA